MLRPFAFDHILTGRSDVQKQVNQVVFQQVDLVDVQKAAVGAGQQPGFENFLSGQRAFQVEGTDDTVFGGAEGQVDDRDRAR